MLKLSWLMTLMMAGFEYIWSKSWAPMIETPLVSGPTSVLIAALLLFSLYRWVVAINQMLREHKSPFKLPSLHFRQANSPSPR